MMVWTGPVSHPDGRVTLEDARGRVGSTLHVDPGLWWWNPADVRWLALHWRLTLTVPPAPPPPPHWLVAGLLWWVLTAPRPLRVVAAFVLLFGYSYGWGSG